VAGAIAADDTQSSARNATSRVRISLEGIRVTLALRRERRRRREPGRLVAL